MKILLIIDSLSSGGAQRQIVNLATGLQNRGAKIELVFYHKSDFYLKKLTDNNVIVHQPSDSFNGFSFKFLFTLRKIIKQDFDVVFSFLTSPSIYTFIARIGLVKCKHIICVRNSSVRENKFSMRFLMHYIAMLFSFKIISNSYSECQNIKNLRGLSKKTYVIWNGYDVEDKKIQLEQKNFKTLLVIARITKQKNGINLMRALNLFLRRNGWCPKIQWAGRLDSDHDSSMIWSEMNKYLLDNSHLKSYWNWLGEVTNIEELFKRSDALILPSLWEGLPNVICESMLNGCNVLASNVCDNPILLKDGSLGILFEPHSPIDICLSIEKFYAKTFIQRKTMAAKAIKFASTELSIKKMVDSYFEIIKEQNNV